MNTVNKSRATSVSRHFLLAAAAGTLLGFGGPVRADLKVVEQITTPSRNGDVTSTVTAYFKGDSLRLENDKGAVTLIDAAAGKVYNIDAANKAYNERNLPPKPAAAPPDAPASTLKLATSSDTSTVAGAKATKDTLTGTTMVGPPPQRQGGQGGAPGGNAQGGDQPGPPPGGDAGPGRPNPATIAGEYWVTTDLSKALTSTAALRPYLDLVAGPIGREGIETLYTSLTAAKQFPLSATVNSTVTRPDGQARQIKFTSVAQSVSKDTLDASLFTLPSDYTKVTTRIPGVGGRQGGPQGDRPAGNRPGGGQNGGGPQGPPPGAPQE
ncbi:MAG TPA: hypothetical protein VGK19_11735 [Capsulimonadaceae bacterium]|jgi:hypothetical protein